MKSALYFFTILFFIAGCITINNTPQNQTPGDAQQNSVYGYTDAPQTPVTHAPIRPDQQPLQDYPQPSNWEFYSQKDGTPLRRADADSVGKMFRPDIAALDTTDRNRFVVHGDTVYYKNFYGDSIALGLGASGGGGANIYNSDGNILAGVERAVGLDSTADLRFYYPSGPAAFRVYGGDDSTATSGNAQMRGPGDYHGRVFVSSDYVSIVKQNSESLSYIEFGPDDPGISIVIDDATPEQGTVLVSNADGFFHFAQIDTLSVANIYNSNGVIENETERAVIVDTLASLKFSTPIDGGDLQLLEIVAGDGTGSNSSVSMSAGTDGNVNRVSIEDEVGIEMYWQQDGRIYLSGIEETDYIEQTNTDLGVSGDDNNGDTGYFIQATASVPEISLGAAGNVGTVMATEMYMSANDEDGEYFLRAATGSPFDQTATVQGQTNQSGVGVSLTLSAYDVNAPQYSLNEIRIDTAGVGINTRGGVGNDGDVLHSNGEKTYWAPPDAGAQTIYNTSATIEDAERTVTLAENGDLSFAYNNSNAAIELSDALGRTILYSGGGSNFMSVSDATGIEMEYGPGFSLAHEDGGAYMEQTADATTIFNGSDPNNFAAIALDSTGSYAALSGFWGTVGSRIGIYKAQGSGIFAQINNLLPDPGQVLVAGVDETFYFADRDTGFITPGVLSADQLSWTGGGNWQPVNANRLLFVQASGTITPSVGVTEIIVNDTATTSTVNLNYTPGELDGASYAQPYTTVRYIYNWGSGDCTVDTNQDWLFRTQGSGAGQTTLTIPTGQSYKLVWVQGTTEANSRFWCFRIQ